MKKAQVRGEGSRPGLGAMLRKLGRSQEARRARRGCAGAEGEARAGRGGAAGGRVRAGWAGASPPRKPRLSSACGNLFPERISRGL